MRQEQIDYQALIRKRYPCMLYYFEEDSGALVVISDYRQMRRLGLWLTFEEIKQNAALVLYIASRARLEIERSSPPTREEWESAWHAITNPKLRKVTFR